MNPATQREEALVIRAYIDGYRTGRLTAQKELEELREENYRLQASLDHYTEELRDVA